jgi:sarcosine oxidase subunit alpha
MRIEKGHVAGNEIDGRTTAADLGLGRMMSQNKDYVGRTMAGRVALVGSTRPALVGLRPAQAGARLRAGAQLVPLGAAADAANDRGVVTSVAFSPSLASWIGLGLLTEGNRQIGARVQAVDPVRDGSIEVEVCAPCFIDPQGERLRA